MWLNAGGIAAPLLWASAVIVATMAGVAAALVIVAGPARVTAGVFVLDPLGDPRPPSFSEWIHNAAGMIYIVTLILAVLAWFVALRTRSRSSMWFAWYSLVTAVAAVAGAIRIDRHGPCDNRRCRPLSTRVGRRTELWILVFAATESRS